MGKLIAFVYVKNNFIPRGFVITSVPVTTMLVKILIVG